MTHAVNEFILLAGGTLAASIVAKATLIAGVGLACGWLARRNRAAVRHAVLAASFAVLLALPIASILVPPVRIAVSTAPRESILPPLFSETITATQSSVPMDAGATATPAVSRWPQPSALDVLFAVWIAGALFFLLRMIVGLRQVRSLRRFGLPWREGQSIINTLASDMGIHRRIDVLLHESLPAPVTCGIVHPAIVLPPDAQTWEREDLNRALVHELEHVRRFDWAVQCFARIVCAVYWFHPLVWVAWHQLSLEAERSCDDAVLGRSEATAYADQLIGLARRLSAAQKSPALAMANRSDLSTRVGSVLDARQARGRAGTLLVAAACIAAAAIVLTMSPLRMVAAPQAGATAAVQNIPKWDVVSIKRCTDAPNTMQDRQSSNRMMLNCKPLEALVNVAYNMFAGGKKDLHNGLVTRIEGFPDWTRSERYAIEAKTQGSPGPSMMSGPMLQALLEDRFRLKVHREIREGKVYTLSVAAGGPKMTTPPPGGCTTMDYLLQYNGPLPVPPPTNPCPTNGGGRPPHKAIDGWMNMDTLSDFLSRPPTLDAPLLNKTGLTDAYHVQLQWVNQTLSPATQETDPPLGPSIFTAVQKLGLKIEAGKGPRQFLVFDHAERPTGN